VVYHPAVASDDLPRIPRNLRRRLARAVAERLTVEPGRYGLPLRGSLRGFWKLRVGDYRVVFRVLRREVWVLAILDGRFVYEFAGSRTAWTPK
jgi:mRNA interferase RelE/StbE